MLSSFDLQTLWKKCLKDKVKNTRCRLDNDLPLVQAKKAWMTKDRKNLPVQQFNINNYLPPMVEGEDDHTEAAHLKSIKKQATKQEKDNLVVRVAMDKTFPQRRVQIVEKMLSVPAIKDVYPVLFNEDQVSEPLVGKHITEVDKLTTSFPQIASRNDFNHDS